MGRNLKWHIFNDAGNPMVWDDMALEFDTKEDAEAYLESVRVNMIGGEEFVSKAHIKEAILYYDGGHLDASYLRVAYDDEKCENYLIAINGEKWTF